MGGVGGGSAAVSSSTKQRFDMLLAILEPEHHAAGVRSGGVVPETCSACTSRTDATAQGARSEPARSYRNPALQSALPNSHREDRDAHGSLWGG